MKECPLINECEDEVTEDIFKTLCQDSSHIQCTTYCQEIRRKQPIQKPREWKKEKEES